MKRLLQELHQGKNLDKNLKEYKELALETYEAYSVLELTFSAYGLVEEISEDKKLAEDAGKGQFEKIKQGLLTLSDPAADYAKLGQEMEELRSRITEKMNLFTAYTDRLIVFEYVLNRMEYQYLSEKERKDKLNGIKQEEFLQKLQRYLFSDKDTSVMQEKIRLVAGQLPVRMTREKFYDCIREAFTLYKGSDKASVDGFVYVLETAGTLYQPAESLEQYETLWNMYSQLETADYKNLDELKEHYQRGGLGDVKVKKFLNNVMQSLLSPMRERRAQWEGRLPEVYEILKKGSETAAEIAQGTLDRVRHAMKIDYFTDNGLLK